MKKSIINAIDSIETSSEMNEVIELIKIKQKQLRAVKALNVKNSISVGSPVLVNSRSGTEEVLLLKSNVLKQLLKSTAVFGTVLYQS